MPFGSTSHLVPYHDRTPVGLGFPRVRHRYHSDSESDLYYRQHIAHVPRPLSSTALRLRDASLKCDRNLGWNIDWAVAFLVHHLGEKSSPGAADTLKKVRIYAEGLYKEGLGKEVAYRVFNKLDQTLFAGHLKDAVFLDIGSLGRDVSGATYSHGWGLDPKVKRISIVLNGDVLQHARSREILAALIHHMIHAYFLVACGPQVEKEVAYGRLGHGHHFGKVMLAIKNLSVAHGKPLGPLGFGHPLGFRRFSHYDDEYYDQKKQHHSPVEEKWYCSHCYSDVNPISEGDIDEWYAGICKPLGDLPDSVRSATVQIYNPILVPAAKIDAFLSMRKAFDKARSRFLEISNKVLPETFMAFLQLLHTGIYGPDPSPVIVAGRKGPPVIKPPQPNSPAYLLTDIRIFQMGCAMGFDELKAIALDRMKRQYITHEDPVTLLKQIYNGGEPDPDLKEWVLKFLVRMP
ncbi:hypothetical protein BDV95DRAFT_517353, partial [Massariosphaeria phaeospora]